MGGVPHVCGHGDHGVVLPLVGAPLVLVVAEPPESELVLAVFAPEGSLIPGEDERDPEGVVPLSPVLALQPTKRAAAAAIIISCFFIIQFRVRGQVHLFHAAGDSQSGGKSFF